MTLCMKYASFGFRENLMFMLMFITSIAVGAVSQYWDELMLLKSKIMTNKSANIVLGNWLFKIIETKY